VVVAGSAYSQKAIPYLVISCDTVIRFPNTYPRLLCGGVLDKNKGLELAKGFEEHCNRLFWDILRDVGDTDLVGRVRNILHRVLSLEFLLGKVGNNIVLGSSYFYTLGCAVFCTTASVFLHYYSIESKRDGSIIRRLELEECVSAVIRDLRRNTRIDTLNDIEAIELKVEKRNQAF
jgi:hypothetical protein